MAQKYLFWVDFVQGVASIESFKTKLGTIPHAMVYKNSYGRFFLTKEEAQAQSEEVTPITIQEVLASETLPLFLITRLERITLYGKDDLKNITKTSKMVWTTIKDITLHMILDKGKLIFPVEYPKENPFRFGYQIFSDSNGFFGVYDVEAEQLVLPFKYKYIKAYGNILILSQDAEVYTFYDLKTHQSIAPVENISYVPQEIKEKIDLSKIELASFLELIPTLESQGDLMYYGLWGAKVWVMEVPSGYEEIVEDSNSGTIEWNHYCSADIFDMRLELPVNFKKKNGEYVSVGIRYEYLVLDKEYRERLGQRKDIFTQPAKAQRITSFEDLLVRGNLPDDPRVVPKWMQIKNAKGDVETLQKELMDEYLLYLQKQQKRFSIYELKEYYPYSDDAKLIRFEATLSSIIWDEMKYIPDYFEQVLTLYHDAYDPTSEYHQRIFEHLVKRFGMLIATLNRIVALTGGKQDSLNWFTGEMIKNNLTPPLEISVSQTKELQSDKKLINFLTLMYAGICDESDENYISNLIEIVYTLFEWYPLKSEACEYAMVEMMKSVAFKEVSVENANAFMSFFEELPRFYEVLSYEKIMQLKSKITHTLATYKPLDNKIFEQKGVKNRLILLNYKIDMEDLYYEGLQTK